MSDFKINKEDGLLFRVICKGDKILTMKNPEDNNVFLYRDSNGEGIMIQVYEKNTLPDIKRMSRTFYEELDKCQILK